jgi:hypothetical protein
MLAESLDGISWPAQGQLSTGLSGDEHGFGRPWVDVDHDGLFHPYHSIRVRSISVYRLGYATSTDDIVWTRRDWELGLSGTPDSFDSHGMLYTATINAHGRTFCFYNENDYRKLFNDWLDGVIPHRHHLANHGSRAKY